MKRLFLSVAGIVFAASISAAEAKKPNVLLILADDLNCRLGCYGDPMVQSPNIDRLAARGVRFDRAYCQYPLCNPSRTCFLTGLRPETTKVWENKTQFRETTPNAVSLGQTFQRAGYYAARVGKLYHYGVPAQIGTDGLEDPASWNDRFNPKGRDVDEVSMIQGIEVGSDGKSRWRTGFPLNGLGAKLSRLAAEGDDIEQTDGKIAEEAIRLLEKNKDRQFLLAVGFFRPHTPYVSPKKYFELYPPGKIQLPTVPAGYRDTVPKAALPFKPDEEGMNDDQRREAIQAYLASVSFMDAMTGRVLDALHRLGLDKNTVVVFKSDHGYHLYEHQLWQKMTLFEDAARVPFIVALPDGKNAGKTCRRTVETVSLHATLADLCGIQSPDSLDGVSFRRLVDDPNAAWERPAITQLRRGNVGGQAKKPLAGVMGYSVRTERWRYTQWGDAGAQGEELYDHDADPRELKNLAAEPGQEKTLKELRALLKKSVGPK